MTDSHDAHARRLAEEALAKLDVRQRVAQMTQVEKNSTTPEEVRREGYGSVLSGGGGSPTPNTSETWRDMVDAFVEASTESRSGIPIVYGVDAVHGHNNMVGATIFPHNIGIGAAGDEDLARRIARATARETSATGIRWTFAPALSIPLDVRWGRSYESYGQDPDLVARLAVATVQGFQGDDLSRPDALLACVKHFVADGAIRYGSSRRVDRDALDQAADDAALANAGSHEAFLERVARGAWMLDQGDAEGSEALLNEVFLPPYRATLDAGVLNVMASYSSWNGIRMHAHGDLLTGLLKDTWQFPGFIVSDWEAIDQLSDDPAQAVAIAINAGVDMSMVPYDGVKFIDTLVELVRSGVVPEARIDDAVRRILYTKARLGLLSEPAQMERPNLDVVGSPEHRALAREAAARTPVLLENRGNLLPLRGTSGPLLVAGVAADDIGLACGGWTITWMGEEGDITPGSTLVDGLREHHDVRYEPAGQGEARAEVGIVVLAEEPYAEGMGDRYDLDLREEHVALVRRVRERVDRLVVVLYSGRPLVLGPVAELADAIVAAWLPGSEAAGVADVLLGHVPFQAKLRFVWPASSDGLPVHPFEGADGVVRKSDGRAAYLPGHGLTPSA